MKLWEAAGVTFGFGCFTYALFIAALVHNGVIVRTFSPWPRVIMYGLAAALWLWAAVLPNKERNGLPK